MILPAQLPVVTPTFPRGQNGGYQPPTPPDPAPANK